MYTIYTRDGCGFCEMAKQIMQEKGILYKEINIWEAADGMNFMKENNHRTVPQILDENDFLIGGYTQLNEFIHRKSNQ